MTDTLTIESLSVSTQIGVYAWEQKIKQQLLLGISIPLSIEACKDNLADTIDYEALCQKVTHFVESKSFQLIETVANDVAQLIQEEFKVTQLTVSVTKPHAIKNAGVIKITVNR